MTCGLCIYSLPFLPSRGWGPRVSFSPPSGWELSLLWPPRSLRGAASHFFCPGHLPSRVRFRGPHLFPPPRNAGWLAC